MYAQQIQTALSILKISRTIWIQTSLNSEARTFWQTWTQYIRHISIIKRLFTHKDGLFRLNHGFYLWKSGSFLISASVLQLQETTSRWQCCTFWIRLGFIQYLEFFFFICVFNCDKIIYSSACQYIDLLTGSISVEKLKTDFQKKITHVRLNVTIYADAIFYFFAPSNDQ